MTEKKTPDFDLLNILALSLTAIGSVGSLYFMFNASRNQNSILLILLFVVWILSPFAGLIIINKISRRRATSARFILQWLMIILAIGSVVVYSGAFNTSKTKNAFIFLVVPLISWILIIIIILTAKAVTRRNSLNSNKNL